MAGALNLFPPTRFPSSEGDRRHSALTEFAENGVHVEGGNRMVPISGLYAALVSAIHEGNVQRGEEMLKPRILVCSLLIALILPATLVAQTVPFTVLPVSPGPGTRYTGGLGDLDGDNLLEVVFVRFPDNVLEVAHVGSSGAYTLLDATPLPQGREYLSPQVADVDGDGTPEIVTWNRANNQKGILTVLYTVPGGRAVVEYPTPDVDAGYGLAFGDLDGDLLPDAITTDLGFAAPGKLHVLWNDPNPTLRFSTETSVPTSPNDLVRAWVGDYDGDGDLDIFGGTHDTGPNSVTVFTNLGGRRFSTFTLDAGDGTRSTYGALSDFDRDGDADLITNADVPNSSTSHLYLYPGPLGPGVVPTQLNPGAHPRDPEVADFNGDGWPDLLTDDANSRDESVLFGDPLAGGLGSTPQVISDPYLLTFDHGSGGNIESVVVGDVDGDGDTDSLIINEKVAFVRNDGGPPSPIELTAIADSFLRQGAPDTNEGANDSLRIQSSGKNRVLVRFDLSGVGTGRLRRATLVLTIGQLTDNWGSSGRPISAHRLFDPWIEGNGWTVGGNTRGSGFGVTWDCASDLEIANQAPDCPLQWAGGRFAASTGAAVVHTIGLSGTVSWDVTGDILAGAAYGWLIKKDEEGQAGKVEYVSREGALAAGMPAWAPRLVLEFE
jgi:VCBS repeat protein